MTIINYPPPGYFLVNGENSLAGGFFDDPLGSVKKVASDIGDAVHTLPGVDWAGDQLKDFARSDVGQTFTRAMASTAFIALAPIAGPQLASIAFALPGVMKGDDFTQAYTSELLYRVKTTADILSAGQGGDAIKGQVGKLFEQVKSATGPIMDIAKKLGAMTGGALDPAKLAQAVMKNPKLLDAQDLAKKLGIREDMAQSAIDLATKKMSFARPATTEIKLPGGITVPAMPAVPGKQFDPKTGKLLTNKGMPAGSLPPNIVRHQVLTKVVAGAKRQNPQDLARLATIAKTAARNQWTKYFLGQGPHPSAPNAAHAAAYAAKKATKASGVGFRGDLRGWTESSSFNPLGAALINGEDLSGYAIESPGYVSDQTAIRDVMPTDLPDIAVVDVDAPGLVSGHAAFNVRTTAGEAMKTYELLPGNDYLLELETRRPLDHHIIPHAFGSALGEVLVELPKRDPLAAGLAGQHGRGGGGFRAGPMRVRSPSFRPGRGHGLRDFGPAIYEDVYDDDSEIVVPEEDDVEEELSGRGGGGRGGGGHGGGRGGGGMRHGGGGRGRGRFRGGWWGGPSYWGPDVVYVDDYDDDDEVIVDDDDIEGELSGALIHRVRLVARPIKVVHLTDSSSVRWQPPAKLATNPLSPPKAADKPVILEEGKRYELRLLSGFHHKDILRYLNQMGLDPDRWPVKIRTSVKVSRHFPALFEYIATGTWTKPKSELKTLTPGFLLEAAKVSQEAPHG
jgi:uncharacterized membrane protein YgcG